MQGASPTWPCLSRNRFRADSPGNCPGKFAHPLPPQRELHQHLVPSEGTGGPAGEWEMGRKSPMAAPGTVLGAEVSGVCPPIPIEQPGEPIPPEAGQPAPGEVYSFPVEMMICLPNGTVVGPPPLIPGPGPGTMGQRKRQTRGTAYRPHQAPGLALPLPGWCLSQSEPQLSPDVPSACLVRVSGRSLRKGTSTALWGPGSSGHGLAAERTGT